MTRALNVLGLVIGLATLGLQSVLTVEASMTAGRTFLLSVWFFFSFFTILSNIMMVLCHAALVFAWPPLAVFGKRDTQGAVVTAMTVVMLVYHVLLRPVWAPEGWFLVCDYILHYVCPLIALVWWALSATGRVGLRNSLRWLIFPLGYLVYVYTRYAVIGEVPYYFLDPKTQALPAVLMAIIGIFVAFVVAGLFIAFLDRLMSRFRTS